MTQKLGKYTIKSILGQGAMGVVYLAHDPLMQRDVALKTVSGDFREDPEMRERFYREARAAGGLRHVNIVTIYDLGEENHQPYIAMELLEGDNLAGLIKTGRIDRLNTALRLARQCCDGLHHAHRHQIVHRDVKPANIFVLHDNTVKIVDFGIARVGSSTITRTGMVMGTVSYMSPEQVQGRELDGRSDQFSLGMVLHEMLTGRKAFPGQSFQEIFYKILNNRADPLTQHYPHCPEPLQAVVDRSLAKRPEDRFPDLEAMSRELERIEAGLGGRAYQLTEPVDLDTGRTARVRQDSLDRVRQLAEAGSLDEARRQLADIRREVKADDPPLLARLEEVEGRIRYLADRTAVAHRLEAVVTMAREGLFQRAESLLERLENDYPGAEEIFQARQTVLEEKRQNEKYHFIKTQVARARLQEESGDMDGALQAIEEALVVYPEEKVLLGYYKKVDARRTARTQRQYIRETCTEVSTLLTGGRLGEAIRRVEQALGRFPDEEVFRNLYRTLLAQKPPPGA